MRYLHSAIHVVLLSLLVNIGFGSALEIRMDKERIPESGIEFLLISKSGNQDNINGLLQSSMNSYQLSLPENSIWELRTTGKNLWFKNRLVTGNESIRLDPFDSTIFHAKVKHKTAINIESSLLRISTSAAMSAVKPNLKEINLEVECPVADDTIECEIPTGQWDISIRFRGFSTIRLWNLAFEGSQNDPVNLSLKEGSSLTGRVVLAEGTIQPKSLQLSIAPFGKPSTSLEERKKLKKLSENITINQWGFFQLDSLEEGTYILEAKYPGFATRNIKPIGIINGKETAITEDIVLELPAKLKLVINPPLSPIGETWKISLAKKGPNPSVFESIKDRVSVPKDGMITFDGLDRGGYYLSVLDSDLQTFFTREIELFKEYDTIHVALDTIWVEGLLEIGESPIEGLLSFSKIDSTARGIEMIADEKGEFFGHLPSDGNWLVNISGQRPLITRSRVKVDIIPTDETAYVTISLPDTHIKGHVTDEHDADIGGARIMVVRLEENTVDSAYSDDSGDFEFRGLPPGNYTIEARSFGRRSRPKNIGSSGICVGNDNIG